MFADYSNHTKNLLFAQQQQVTIPWNSTVNSYFLYRLASAAASKGLLRNKVDVSIQVVSEKLPF